MPILCTVDIRYYFFLAETGRHLSLKKQKENNDLVLIIYKAVLQIKKYSLLICLSEFLI